MGLTMEGNSIGIYKVCIKDADSLKDLTLPLLFGESNRLNLGPIPSFLPILTAVEGLLIACVYIYLQVLCVRGQQHYYRALQDQLPPGGGGKFRARFHSRLGNPCKFARRSLHLNERKAPLQISTKTC